MAKARPKAKQTVKYPKPTVELFGGNKAMTHEDARQLLGCTELPDKPKGDPAEWGKTIEKTVVEKGKRTTIKVKVPKPDASVGPDGKTPLYAEEELLRDLNGKRVVTRGNNTNRPFRMAMGKKYMNEILRRKWKLNGETIILDRMGGVHNGQHRLIGLVLAYQAWKRELDAVTGGKTKGKEADTAHAPGAAAGKKHDPSESATKGGWLKFWPIKEYPQGPVMETVVVKGISEDPATVDTIDQGQKRTGGDVFYRQDRFPGLPRSDRATLTKLLAQAARLVWIRAGGRMVSNAPQLPMSELCEFVEDHDKLQECVAFIWQLDKQKGDERGISRWVSLSYAAGLLYLMQVSGTDPDEYAEHGVNVLDTETMHVKALKFWRLLGSGGEDGVPKEKGAEAPVFAALRSVLAPINSGSGSGRDEIVGSIIKAFNCWVDDPDGKWDMEDVQVGKSEDADLPGRWVLDEEPRLGGIDVERGREADSLGEADAAPAKGRKGKKAKAKEEAPASGNKNRKGKRGGQSGPTPEAKRSKSPKPAPKAELPKPSPRKRREASELPVGEMAGDKWAAGDKCWVCEPDEAEWFGTIDLITDNGKVAFVTNDADGKDWEVSVKWLSLVHPDA